MLLIPLSSNFAPAATQAASMLEAKRTSLKYVAVHPNCFHVRRSRLDDDITDAFDILHIQI